MDPVVLNEDNNWTAELSGLPHPDSLNELEYSVVESPVPKNSRPEYSSAIIDKENKVITISVNNVYDPSESEPVLPEGTDNTPGNKDDANPAPAPIPMTGDISNIGIWIGIMVISFLSIVVYIIKIKRKQYF